MSTSNHDTFVRHGYSSSSSYDGEDSGLSAPAPAGPAPPSAPAPEPSATTTLEPMNEAPGNDVPSNLDQNENEFDPAQNYDSAGYNASDTQEMNWQNDHSGQGHVSQYQGQADDFERPIGSKEDG